MADLAEDKANGVQEKGDIDKYGAGGETAGGAAADGDVKTDNVAEKGQTTKPSDTSEAEDIDNEDDEEGTTKSREQKRKEGPVSVSAHDRKRYTKQINSRFDDQPESNDADEIRRQVEFYFSDSNLPVDAFLLLQTGGHLNKPVPLRTICSFKRMRHFLPYTAVRDAVKQSTFLDLNDDDDITRKVPLSDKFGDSAPDNRKLVHSSSMPRSIYAKGFGEEGSSTHLDIEAFFAPYGPLKSVRLRRAEDGLFKGSVFVEFEDDELQKRFLELDLKPQWEGKDLQIMSKQAYVDLKHNGIIDGSVKPRSPVRGYNGNRGRNHGRRYDDRDKRGSRDKIDRDDWKTRRDRDQRDDRRRGRDGRGSGKGWGGGRKDRRGSPDFRDRKRKRDNENEDRDRPEDDVIKAEVQTLKTEEDVGKGAVLEASAAAGADAAETKKHALTDGAEGQGEAKKVKVQEDDS